jgi:AraC-like DNA-binding protein
MGRAHLEDHPLFGDRPASAPLRARTIAEGRDWCVREYICTSGPADRPFEERHEGFTVASVLEGSFKYRSDRPAAMLHPGALLLGNSGMSYECGHDHSSGDRCIAFHFAPSLFAEAAFSATGTDRFRFPVAMLPASNGSLPWIAWIEARTSKASRMAIEETATSLLDAVIVQVSGAPLPLTKIGAREERRISSALRYIEMNAGDDLNLDILANAAAMSKYHFLRVFRKTVGMTPYQFLLNERLRRAAVRLATSPAPISEIAFECGFGDLSTFNNRFREVFRRTPTAYRRAEKTVCSL